MSSDRGRPPYKRLIRAWFLKPWALGLHVQLWSTSLARVPAAGAVQCPSSHMQLHHHRSQNRSEIQCICSLLHRLLLACCLSPPCFNHCHFVIFCNTFCIYFLEVVVVHLGVMLGSFWGHVGVILASFWCIWEDTLLITLFPQFWTPLGAQVEPNLAPKLGQVGFKIGV